MLKINSKKDISGQKGFKGKCFICNGQGHRKKSCPKRHSHIGKKQRQSSQGEGSADVTKAVVEGRQKGFNGKCFICHGPGHRQDDCPKRDSHIGQGKQQAAQGRVLGDVPRDADVTKAVVEGRQQSIQTPVDPVGVEASKAMVEGEIVLEPLMGTPGDKKYAIFEEQVRRTVYLDNLSPAVTEAVMKTALGQFGNVTKVQFIPNYKETKNIPLCALVEMESSKQAKSIVSEMADYPFMMSGMPRPVRARAAEAEMFADRPRKPSRKIECRWVYPKDPDFETAQKLKTLVKRHAAEASLMLELQLAEEEKLAKQQAEMLKANYKKYEMMDNLMGDGTLNRLARRYNLNINDD